MCTSLFCVSRACITLLIFPIRFFAPNKSMVMCCAGFIQILSRAGAVGRGSGLFLHFLVFHAFCSCICLYIFVAKSWGFLCTPCKTFFRPRLFLVLFGFCFALKYLKDTAHTLYSWQQFRPRIAPARQT